MNPLLGILVRVPVVYGLILLLVRISGKRDIGAVAPEDFVVALVLSDLFDNLFYGTTAMAIGLTACVALVAFHSALSWAAWRNRTLSAIFRSHPTRLVTRGRAHSRSLRAERIPREDLPSLLRSAGEAELDRIEEACLETNGHVGLVLKKEARPARRADLDALRRLLK